MGVTAKLKCVFVLSAFFFLTSSLLSAQTKYKMTTDIPASIITPDKVETPIGTLKFVDGFPDKETVTKVYDNLDFQRGTQAYLQALPIVSIEGARRAILSFGPANQTCVISEQLLDSKSLFLTANTTTPYSCVWLDLKDGPLVLEIPSFVLGPIDDALFKWDSDIGFTGPDKGKGGKYLLLPPGYSGSVPDNYFVVKCRTFGHLMFFRTFLKDGNPSPGVENVKKNLKIYSLSQAANPPAMQFFNMSGKAFNTIGPSDFSAFEYTDHMIQAEPADVMPPDMLGLYASIGIEKGKTFSPDARMKKILVGAAAVGDATARTLTYQSKIKEAFFYPNSGWLTVFIGGSYTFQDSMGVRILDAQSMMFFYATGITPAMSMKMVGQGSAYAGCFIDSKGEALDGSKTYKIHLPPNIPAKEFWSFTAYDNQTRSMLQTDQQFPAVGSENKKMLVNKDGSVDIYFGPKAPAGQENNWVQTIPGKGWNTLLRLYGPLDPWFNKAWQPGEFVATK
jgi:hypothetical protein